MSTQTGSTQTPPAAVAASHSGTMVYTLLLLFGFTSALAQRSLDPLTIRISEDLLVAPETVALLSTAIAIPFALAQPVLGPLGDHFGKDKVIKGALWLLALSTFASAFAPAFLWLMGLRVLSGAASGGIIPISQAIVADLYTGHRRQICIARITMAAFIGQLAGASFAGMVVGWIGWRGVLLACSTVVFAAAILASVRIPKPPPLARGPLSVRAIVRNYGLLFRMPRAWACYATGFMQSGTLFGLLPFIAYLLENQKNGGPREAGLVIAGFCMGSLVFALSAGWILRLLSRPLMITSGAIITAIALFFFAQGYDWTLQTGIFTIVGFGFFLQHNAIQGEVSNLSEELRASAYSMHAFAFCAGTALSPILYGLAFPSLGAKITLICAAVSFASVGAISATAFLVMYRRGI
ncbi:MAG: MFS transporter [Hyphomicrobiales bacterium]|nr:MFS transporter [Hyphomicrobiales bacterium]